MLTFGLAPVEQHERRSPQQEQHGGGHRVGETPGALGNQHQRHGTEQHAAAKGDHEVAEFVSEPVWANAFDAGERRSRRDAGTGEGGPQQEFQQLVQVPHRGPFAGWQSASGTSGKGAVGFSP